MTNKESDPGAFARPKPKLGGVFLNCSPVEGGVLQGREGDKGRPMDWLRDCLGEDIESKARVCCPEERERAS